jgi:hypothetical protein
VPRSPYVLFKKKKFVALQLMPRIPPQRSQVLVARFHYVIGLCLGSDLDLCMRLPILVLMTRGACIAVGM